MTPCHVVQITTPKKFLLNGLWFGPTRPKRAVVWIHGLSSSAFSRLDIVERLRDDETAVLTFNNRGSGSVMRVGRVVGKKTKRVNAGAAHERFEECVDDIQGAINFARARGVREIYLAGHSTGCQKAMYWAYKKKTGVDGIVLLAPISDYASAIRLLGKKKVEAATRYAKAQMKKGTDDDLLPERVWSDGVATARRFLSLYTPDSTEQRIFSYFDPAAKPTIYRAVRLPLLVLLAENDEFSDRPAAEIAAWCEKHTGSRYFEVEIIPGVEHGFKGGEAAVVTAIRKWAHMH